MEYNFTIYCELPTDDVAIEDIVGRLAKVGCTDAVLLFGWSGQLAFQFAREADSEEAAVLSAIKDLKAALPDAMLDGAQLLSQLLKPHI